MTRPTLLLIDSFSAHDCAVKTLMESENPPFKLQHTRVEFLPKNVTSHYQPLDQGIIRAWKAYYKRKWLQFMVDCVHDNKDPLKEVNMLHVVRWAILAWDEVTKETIENCWVKSTCLGKVQTVEKILKGWEEREAVINEAQELLDELERRRVIKQKMTVEMLINTPGEEVEDSQDDALQQVIDIFYQEPELEPEESELQKIKEREVLEMLQKLQLYEE